MNHDKKKLTTQEKKEKRKKTTIRGVLWRPLQKISMTWIKRGKKLYRSNRALHRKKTRGKSELTSQPYIEVLFAHSHHQQSPMMATWHVRCLRHLASPLFQVFRISCIVGTQGFYALRNVPAQEYFYRGHGWITDQLMRKHNTKLTADSGPGGDTRFNKKTEKTPTPAKKKPTRYSTNHVNTISFDQQPRTLS